MGTLSRKSLYGKIESTKKELKFLRLTQKRQIAQEVLDIYNKSKEEHKIPDNKNLFFDALDEVWKAHHFHDEKITHKWHDKNAFHKDIIPVCHSLQPGKSPRKKKSSRKGSAARKYFPENEEEYIQSVLEDIEYVLERRMESEIPFREALSFAVKSTWQREEKSVMRKNLWESKKVLKDESSNSN
jgi:hypothetical protein